jgi:S-adenosylmethionine:tRNA ribosyltransferase-isomerase
MKTFIESQTKDFDYFLPPELIAYSPTPKRDASRMLVLNRKSGNCEIRNFRELSNYLDAGDCAVINDSKVIKARIFAAATEAPEKIIELFLLEPLNASNTRWSVLSKPARNLKKYSLFNAIAPEGKTLPALTIRVKKDELKYEVEFSTDSHSSDEESIEKILDSYGHIPLPPYIKRPDEESDEERYQTVYATHPGSVAAPTAGLHFTDETFAKFAELGIQIARLTLHVGVGTFRPVRTEKLSEHKMHSEHFVISPQTAEKINSTKKNGGKILAVGTTSLRALESSISANNTIIPKMFRTNIFIYPPYKIHSADMLLTNFHLPKSTLLMLVCAFAGTEATLNAYKFAINEKFRFYSYGDCMLII